MAARGRGAGFVGSSCVLCLGGMKAAWEVELEAALKKDVDLHGDDPSLALVVAAMSEEQKAQSRANTRACVAEMQATLRKKVARDDHPGDL